jgi:hypothetical protein
MKECFMSSPHRFSLPAALALSLAAAAFSPALLAQDSGVQSSPNRNIDDATRAKAMGGDSANASSSSSSSDASGTTMGSKVENAAGRAKNATVRTGKRARGAVERGAARADQKIRGVTGDAKSTPPSGEPVIKN